MIRINLLPFRLARKKENIRRQVSIFLLMIVLSVVALFWWTMSVNKKLGSVQQQTANVKQQAATYKEKAERVKTIQHDLKVLEDKLGIVASLKKQRDDELILFDSMTGLVVPERMWLSSLSTARDSSLVLKGVAFDNVTIADFMKNLEASPLFNQVDLKTSETKKFNNDVMLKAFELQCRKKQPESEKVVKKGKK